MTKLVLKTMWKIGSVVKETTSGAK